MVLIGQYIYFEKVLIIIASLVFSGIMACCIYKKTKQAQEIDIQYLKYSRLFVYVIFTIIFSLLNLFNDKIKIIHYLFFLSPLLMLQVVYEKIDLQRKRINCVSIKSVSKTPDTGEKEQVSERQGNTTVSGTICVNLEVKI
jgi:hypothetical protein